MSSFINAVKAKINIIDIISKNVKLTRKGAEHQGLCPFHSEKTPSFYVNSAKALYNCFGCGASGDGIKFYSQINGIDYLEAAKVLAREHGISIQHINPEEESKKDKIYHLLQILNKHYAQSINNNIKDYLSSREITKDIIEEYEIGFCKKYITQEFIKTHNIDIDIAIAAGILAKGSSGSIYEVFRDRITFPIKNIYGRICGFGARALSSDVAPKYLNSPETIVFKKSEILYGEHIAFKHSGKANKIFVVEGYLDVISMHIEGYLNTVATLGTSFCSTHMAKLWSVADEICFCFDGDSAGKKATLRAINIALPYLKADKTITICNLPNGQDPDQFLKNSASKEEIDSILTNSITISEILWKEEISKCNISLPEGLAKLDTQLNIYVNKINDSVIKKHYARYFNNKIWELSHNKHKKKKSAFKYTTLPSNNNETQKEGIIYIERIILAILLQNLTILKNYSQLELLSNIDFHSKEYIEIKEIYLNIDIEKTHSKEDLDKIYKKHGYYKEFNLIFNIDLRDNIAHSDICYNLDVFIKKHRIECIKNELKAMGLKDLKQNAMIYQHEIKKLEQNIEEIIKNK